MELNDRIISTLSAYKKNNSQHATFGSCPPVPFNILMFHLAHQLIENAPDVYIDARILKYVSLYPDGRIRAVNYISELTSRLNESCGGMITHINIHAVSVSTMQKHVLPIIQIHNAMIVQGIIPDLTQVVRKTIVYFSSDIIRTILKMVKPLINESVYDNICILSKSDSVEFMTNISSAIHANISTIQSAYV